MTYEICGDPVSGPKCAAYYRTSRDGWNYGAPSDFQARGLKMPMDSTSSTPPTTSENYSPYLRMAQFSLWDRCCITQMVPWPSKMAGCSL